MASPHRPDEGHIADTGMFQRFVDHGQQIEQEAAARTRRWVFPVVVVVLVLIAALVVWLLLR